MGVLEHWKRIVDWLAVHAPTTGSALRPAENPSTVDALVRETGLTPPAELAEWWSVCGGTERLAFAEVLPPFYTPIGPTDSLKSWRLKRKFWPADTDTEAGAPTVGFHPSWLPIAFDGCGDALAVDVRPGLLSGCVVEWDRQRGEMVKPEWVCVEEMLDQVATALEHNSAIGHCEPLVHGDGRLDWRTA